MPFFQTKNTQKKTKVGESVLLSLFIYSYVLWEAAYHYKNMPIQIYWKFYHEKMKIFR